MTSPQKPWLSIGLIVILTVINLLLIRQNLDLRRQLSAGGRTLDLTENVLKPGDVVSAVTVSDVLDKVDSNRFTVVGIVSDQENRQIVSAHAEGAGYLTRKTPLPIVFFNSESLGNTN